jgi:hypothetical protein
LRVGIACFSILERSLQLRSLGSCRDTVRNESKEGSPT